MKTNIEDGAVQQLLSDKEYCISELNEIREAFGNKKRFTPQMIDASKRVLIGMTLYAPEEIQTLVESHLSELEMREQILLCGKIL